MRKYIIPRDSFTDKQWYDVIQKQENLPSFEDTMKDPKYKPLFQMDLVYELSHDNLCVTDYTVWDILRLDYLLTTNELDEAIDFFLGLNHVYHNNTFEIKGDSNGDEGFIVDVWDSFGEPKATETFWFEDFECER